MKKTKILSILILCMFLLSSCSNATYDALKKQYPDSKITGAFGAYNVISENVEYEGAKTQAAGTADRTIYEDINMLNEKICADREVIFIGKKTGQSRQKIPVMKDSVNGIFFTESKVEVITPYYGDVAKGQTIVLQEYYAVFTNENGEKTLNYVESLPIKEEEKIFVLTSCGQSELYDGFEKYAPITNTVPLDAKKLSSQLQKQLYDKYYVKNDVAVDKTELAEKLLKKQERKLNNPNLYTEAEIDDAKRAKSVLDSKTSDYNTLASGLTDAQKQLIERLAVRYGEK